MDSRFFFITTYDSISGALLALLLNEHPDVYCSVSFSDSMLRSTAGTDKRINNKIVDSFITTKSLPHTQFNGNAQFFSAFELQHRMIAERVIHPIRKINLAVTPENRIHFLLKSWLDEYHSATNAIQSIEQLLENQRKQHDTLLASYRFDYFYDYVHSLANSMSATQSDDDKLFLLALTKMLAYDSTDLAMPGRTFLFEDAITNENKFTELFCYLTNESQLHSTFLEAVRVRFGEIQAIVHSIKPITWDKWKQDILEKCLHTRFETVNVPIINKPLTTIYQDLGHIRTAPTTTNRIYSKLISIQLNSNRPAQLAAYFDNIEETADAPQDIEVLVNVDTDDAAMTALLKVEEKRRKFTLKYITSDRPTSFCDLWKPINKLLAITDPDSYFLLNISDEMLFATKGWDTELKKYVGFFPDHIFRLRASRNKFRNYFDRWECSFAQDSIPITTKRWIDIGGDWNPCFGPDSFQQLIAFYLAKDSCFEFANYLRELPILNITFYGDVPALGTDRDKEWKRINEHITAMQICQSHAMQTEARRRAMMLKAHIIAHTQQSANFTIVDNVVKQQICLIHKNTNVVVARLSYRLSWLSITLVNQWRKLFFHAYFGDGKASRHFIKSPMRYVKARSQWLQTLYLFLLQFKRRKRTALPTQN